MFGNPALWLLPTIYFVSKAFWCTLSRGIYGEGPSYPLLVVMGPAAVFWLASGWLLLNFQFGVSWNWWHYGAGFVLIAIAEIAAVAMGMLLPTLLTSKQPANWQQRGPDSLLTTNQNPGMSPP